MWEFSFLTHFQDIEISNNIVSSRFLVFKVIITLGNSLLTSLSNNHFFYDAISRYLICYALASEFVSEIS